MSTTGTGTLLADRMTVYLPAEQRGSFPWELEKVLPDWSRFFLASAALEHRVPRGIMYHLGPSFNEDGSFGAEGARGWFKDVDQLKAHLREMFRAVWQLTSPIPWGVLKGQEPLGSWSVIKKNHLGPDGILKIPQKGILLYDNEVDQLDFSGEVEFGLASSWWLKLEQYDRRVRLEVEPSGELTVQRSSADGSNWNRTK